MDEQTGLDALELIQALGKGRALESWYAAMLRVGNDTRRTGQKGKVVLSVEFTRDSASDPIVVAKAGVTSTTPKDSAGGAYWYALDGKLSNDDPRQMRMELGLVDRETGEILRAEAMR